MLAVAFAAGSNRANSEVLFFTDGVATNENPQFNDGLEGGPAVKIQGLTNKGTLVDVSRLDLDPILLVKGASGQARVEATDPGDNGLFSGALFETPSATFTAFEFNVHVDEDGLLTILAKDTDGITYSSALQAGFNGAVSNGENRFGVTADGGIQLVSVEVRLNGLIVEDIRQVRLGIEAVPEPTAVVLSLMCLAALGLFARSHSSSRMTA